jgi:hypothetical protein
LTAGNPLATSVECNLDVCQTLEIVMPIAYLRQLALALERTKNAVRVTHPYQLALVQWLWSRGYIEAKISAVAASSRAAADVLCITGLGRQLIGLQA